MPGSLSSRYLHGVDLESPTIPVQHSQRLRRGKHLMNRWAGIFFTLLASTAVAGHQDDRVINSGSELRDWCKDASQATLIGRGLSPSNWTASYWDQVDTLMVKGQWRVEGSNFIRYSAALRGVHNRDLQAYRFRTLLSGISPSCFASLNLCSCGRNPRRVTRPSGLLAKVNSVFWQRAWTAWCGEPA